MQNLSLIASGRVRVRGFAIGLPRPCCQLASRTQWPAASLVAAHSMPEASTLESVHSVSFEATMHLHSVRSRSDPSCCARCGLVCCARRPYLLCRCCPFSPRACYAPDPPADPLLGIRYSLGAGPLHRAGCESLSWPWRGQGALPALISR